MRLPVSVRMYFFVRCYPMILIVLSLFFSRWERF
jgi:hypothetical protein